MQLGARFYWPELGRFVQQDPIRDGMNWYAYAEGNPVVWIDPEGLLFFLGGCGRPTRPEPTPAPSPADPCAGAETAEECCQLKYEAVMREAPLRTVAPLGHIVYLDAARLCLNNCLIAIARQPGGRASVNFARGVFDLCWRALKPTG